MSWYSTGYHYKKQITIDHTKVGGGSNLSSFPVLISRTDTDLRTVSNGGKVSSVSGYDIIFTDGSETTKLDHELENYVATTGEVEVWVRIPTLSATTDTVIYMYYSNSSITASQENVPGVWDSNYKGVYHLANGTTLSATDSTANNHNGIINALSATAGKIDGAGSFNGGYITASSFSVGATTLTASAWVYSSNFNQNGMIVEMSPVNSAWELFFVLGSGNIQLTGGGVGDVVALAPTNSAWHLIEGVWNGTTGTIYVDGVQAATGAITAIPTSVSTLNIGTFDAGGYSFTGMIDEVRVSSVVRSPGWISTEYANQNSPSTFISVGVAQLRPVGSYSVTLAGQDITQYIDQMTIEIDDTLAQGAGAGTNAGRASTVKFNTTLGPMSKAVGAGQGVPQATSYSGYVSRPFGVFYYSNLQLPVLVRQGEIIVTDATGTVIFGGFATKYTDTSTSVLGQTKQNFTTVEGIDYSTSLARTLVNEVFTGATDVYIIQYIMNKYVGWVNLQYLPANPGYTFDTKNFRNVSVEQVLQTVAGVTGYLVFVDYLKNLHYVSPTTASSAPFNLSSAPDFVTTFPHAVEEYLVDDNSAINRVFFYGGTKTSNDFWQDISPLANGNNVTFPLAYYPSPMTDGKYHLKINGVDGTVATSTTAGSSGQFISQGGTATVLIDPGAKTITFDTGYAPATGTSLIAGYRYAFPLSLIITDEGSHQYYGGAYLDGSIDDNTIFDITTAIQRCKILLSQQSYGLVTLKVEMYNKPGVQAGMVIHVYNQLRGINGTYLVQEVQISPLGAGNFVYHLTLGAWNWNLIDYLMKLPVLATFQDNQTETQETVNIVQVLTNVKVHDAWSTKLSTQGLYYARATAVGDGHDAYPGFSTVTS